MAFERITPFCAPESRLDAMLAQRFESNGRLFSDAAPAPYANFLSTWLHQPGKWYAAEQLTESNFDFMRLKAKSILLEHSLTDRVLAAGGTLHSIYDGGGLVDRVLGRVGERYDKVWCMPDRFQSLRRHGAAGRSEPRHASTMADLQK